MAPPSNLGLTFPDDLPWAAPQKATLHAAELARTKPQPLLARIA